MVSSSPRPARCASAHTRLSRSASPSVKHDRGVAAPDVLGDQQLGQPGFTHARRAVNHRVPYALAQIQRDVDFVRFDAVYGRVAADRRQRADRIQNVIGVQQFAQRGLTSSRAAGRLLNKWWAAQRRSQDCRPGSAARPAPRRKVSTTCGCYRRAG